jgi:serine/threonine protein kinase
LDNKNQIRTIGSGSFGNVFLFKNTIDDKIYAIKHMEKKKLFKLLNTLNGIYREIDIQSKIEHENIIKILYSHESKESFNLVMEYAQNGSLFHYIRRNNGLSESQTFQLFIQVVNAVYFLHKNNLIHRDIKPENILLFNNDDENDNNKNNFLVKLCDFGWCVKLDEGESRKTFCGTTEYMSPELIDRKGYSKEIDVWSLGILLYEMIHGFSPFRPNKPKFEEKEVFENIKKHELKFGENISERCKNLIINLLTLNKNERYKVEDIYNSEFVKYYENNNYCIPKCNKIKIELKENNENKKIKKSFSKISDNTRYRNGVDNLKKISNSYISKIPSKIYSMIYTKRNSNKSKDKSNIIHLKKSNKLFKENSFSFIDIIKKESKNKRNKNINRINKVNSKFNLNTEKIYIKTNGRNNTKSFDNFQKQKSIPNIKSSDNILNKTKNKNKIQMNKLDINNICDEDLEDNNIFLNFFSKFKIECILNFISEDKDENGNNNNLGLITHSEAKRKKINGEEHRISIKQKNISIPKNMGDFSQFYNLIQSDFDNIIEDFKFQIVNNNCIIIEFDEEIQENIKMKLLFVIVNKITGLCFEDIGNYLKNNFFVLEEYNEWPNKEEMENFLK